jgi:hypothetical protein
LIDGQLSLLPKDPKHFIDFIHQALGKMIRKNQLLYS